MIALARKYRPKRFADLLVQDHVAAALRGAVAQGRTAHGYLFAGPRGVGKTTAARILAMALNCERATAGEPCGECESCARVWTGATNLDVIELDAASNRGVDDARELRERAMYAASSERRHKVYIVDEAHMLTREAWNALLKVLEEPPPRVVFVFATTEPQRIAQTAAPVLSRLQRFDFRRIGPEAIVTRLRQVTAAEALAADDDALRLIARVADGGMRDALSVLDQVIAFGEGPVSGARVREVLGLIPDDVYGEVLRLVAERDPAAVFPVMDRLVEGGADLGAFVVGLGDTLRAVLLIGFGGHPDGLTEGLRAEVQARVAALPPADVLRLLTVLAEVEQQIRLGGHSRLGVEVLLLRWAMMDRTVDLDAVLAALGTGPGGAGRPAPPAPSRPPPASPPTPPPARTAPAAPGAGPASAPPPRAEPEQGPLTADRLRVLWPQIVEVARSSSPMVGTLLAGAEVAGVGGATVEIRPSAASGNLEGLAHKRAAIARVLAAWVEGPVQVRVVPAAGAGGAVGRLTPREAEAERLRVLRAKDPALSAAVDALDLELLE